MILHNFCIEENDLIPEDEIDAQIVNHNIEFNFQNPYLPNDGSEEEDVDDNVVEQQETTGGQRQVNVALSFRDFLCTQVNQHANNNTNNQ